LEINVSKLTKNAIEFIEAANRLFGNCPIVTRDGIDHVISETGCSYPYWLVNKSEYRVGRGKYKLPSINGKVSSKNDSVQVSRTEEKVEQEMTVDLAQVVQLRQPKLVDDSDISIPAKYPDYVPFGFFKDMSNIIASRQFYPVFVTGLSGNGKTLMVEQACANLQRECIRVNISVETDESDLIGGPTLVNGNVVNRDGPVITAMKRGAVLLIDEVDRGSNKLMCLQGILEGKPYFNKKSGEMVYPAAGFNVVATANTKGKGSEEGRYLSQILDDAFLERFPITVEQEYPDAKTETKILNPLIDDKDFVKNLVKWADVVRQTFDQGGIDEIISTRRLVHIAKAYTIFGDRMRAIELCVSRFDTETKTAFLDLYSKVDADVLPPSNTTNQTVATEVPF
jgi:MoxR-like ATPase